VDDAAQEVDVIDGQAEALALAEPEPGGHGHERACVRLLADAVSTLPLDVYRRGEQDPLPELPPLLRSRPRASA
jgi:hypothetical protein